MTKLFIQFSILSILFPLLGCGSTGPIGTFLEECNRSCELAAALSCPNEQWTESVCKSSCESDDEYYDTQDCQDAQATYYHCMNNLDLACTNSGALPDDFEDCRNEFEDRNDACNI